MREAGASEWKEGAEGRGKRPKRGQTPTLTSSATLGKFSIRYSDGTLYTYILGITALWEGRPRQEETLHPAPEDTSN